MAALAATGWSSPTGDKDPAAGHPGRSRWSTMTNETLDEVGAYLFGVRPERIIDYLTPIGDAVDNARYKVGRRPR